MTQRLRSWIARLAAAASVVAPLLAASSGRAAEDVPVPPATVAAYEVPAGCATQESFVADVQRRTRRRDAASVDREATHSFRVRVESHGRDRFRGTIAVRRTSAAAGDAERVVDGATCTEVMQALALVAALSMDDAAAARAPGTETAAGNENGSGNGERIVAPAANAAASTNVANAAAEAGATPAADVPASSSRTPARSGLWSRARFAAGAHAGAQRGAGPGVGLAFPVFVELAFAPRSEDRKPLLRFAPAMRLTFVRGSTDTTVRTRGSATFTWTAGELDLCPVVLGTPRLFATACARLELGVLAGGGEQVEPARSETRLWAAVAVPVRLRFAVTRALFVELEAAPRAPLQRARFIFQPDITVFQAPAVAWAASAGGGITFP